MTSAGPILPGCIFWELFSYFIKALGLQKRRVASCTQSRVEIEEVCCGLNVLPPQNWNVKALTPNVMLFGDEAIGDQG